MSDIRKLIFWAGACLSVLIIVSCGSGANTTSDSDKGNVIRGALYLSQALGAGANAQGAQVRATKPYSGSKVLLVDKIGAILDAFNTDETGSFSFKGLAYGDYMVRVVDMETRKIVTEVTFSLVNGDDATVAGEIIPGEARWDIRFSANDSVIIENESQQIYARDISDVSGRSFDEVISMRGRGMGWGEIAQSLSVNTIALGLSYDKGFAREKSTAVTDDSIGSSSKP